VPCEMLKEPGLAKNRPWILTLFFPLTSC
jgi:hypothetical protein